MKSTQFLDNLNTAVRENPVAAGLIGLGVAWIVFGKSGGAVQQAGGARSAKRAVGNTIDIATSAVSGAVDQAQKAASGLSDALSQGFATVSVKMGDAVEGLKTSSHEPPRMQSEFGRHFPPPSSTGLANLLDRQPLALAAIGMAVGAAIASAFPTTDVERQVMGTTGEKLKEGLADATETLVDKTGSAIDAVVDEAVAQNLTPEGVRSALRAGADKVQTMADAGLSSFKK